MTSSSDIILHHFDPSPFSEKIRIIFGYKKIAWKSCLISRIMPRPDLMPLTGGYRRTPVMQIGADIFCDTQIIIRELEARFPNPTLFPGGNAGIPWALGMWTDRPWFQSTVSLVFGSLGDKVPQDFIDDRSKLRGAQVRRRGDDGGDPADARPVPRQCRLDRGAACRRQEVSARRVQPRRRQRLHERLVRAAEHAGDRADILGHFPLISAWEKRIQAFGHGTRSEISTAEALEIGTRSTPQAKAAADPNDPNGRKPGDVVSVHSDDAWKTDIRGEIVSLSAQHIAIRRKDDRAGEVVVHFPRAGFTIS